MCLKIAQLDWPMDTNEAYDCGRMGYRQLLGVWSFGPVHLNSRDASKGEMCDPHTQYFSHIALPK